MNPSVLSSRKLSKSQARLLAKAGISYCDYNAIKITFVDFKISSPVKNAIITSQNTVKALLRKEIEIDCCFCVGKKTKTLLEKHQYRVQEMTEYGKELGELLVRDYAEEEFVFFCGDKRRPEMPGILRNHEVHFKEIQVYKNEANPCKFNRQFNGLLFFSPSQIKSYTTKNEFKQQIAFCIGTTTAAAAKKHTHKVIIAEKPSVENVIKVAIKTLKS